MYDLVAKGYVYVAQPPLFRVRKGKQVNYVQTEEEMKSQLLDLGLGDSVFDAGDGLVIEGEQMARLVRTLAALEEAIIALERRGISLKAHALRQEPASGRLPIYHVFLGFAEHWFTGPRVVGRLRQGAGGGRGRGTGGGWRSLAERSQRRECGADPGRCSTATRRTGCGLSSCTRSGRSTRCWATCGRSVSRSSR